MATQPFLTYAATSTENWLIALSRATDTKPWGKLIASITRRLVGITHSGPIDVETWGIKMRLDPSRNVAEKRLLFAPSRFDIKEREFLAAHLKAGDVFVDIGANIGGYSMWATKCVGSSGKVLALEPQPSVLERLRTNASFNPELPIIIVPMAAGETQSTMRMSISASNDGEGSLAREVQSGGYIEVQVMPLTDILAANNITRIDALKIDVEGFEETVLLPFFAKADKALWPKMIVLERGDGEWKTDLCGHLLELGYTQKATTRMNYVLEIN
ncbi:MAG: FkbM family methyltransferase [Hyphomonadaceae bacterium]|nr:MAG: FkbM family methyltransferase [Hyphomonadaceae bacterium]KAF0183290.1 MAG: FkbM family methyltransferase [Hyphomonadaceae bacterium]